MTTFDDPRLDDFERRLHELEGELAELRLALAAGVGEDVEAVEPLDESGVPAWAQQSIDRGDLRGLLNTLEYSRRQTLRDDDLAGLGELLRVELRAPGWESEGLSAGRALRLTEALHQNVRFLERKLGVVVDVAPHSSRRNLSRRRLPSRSSTTGRRSPSCRPSLPGARRLPAARPERRRSARRFLRMGNISPAQAGWGCL